MRRVQLGLLALACLSGCGSSPPLSLRQLRGEAAAICHDAAARTGRIATPAAPAGSARFLTVGRAVLRDELARLRALDPPGPQAVDLRRALGALRESIDLVGQAQAAIAHGTDPAAAVRSLQSTLAPVEAREDAAWASLGISGCNAV